jgi:hypothetical protein
MGQGVRKGLRPKVGTPDNGQQCEEDFSLRAVLESESLTIGVMKPGSLTNRTLTLIVEARGEAELGIAFNVTMTRFEASSGALIAANGSISVDVPSMSAFGQHIEWKQRPLPIWQAVLDGTQFKYADTLRHEFTVRLGCDRNEQNCAADGDIITTTVQLASPQDSRLRSEARVLTRVEALVSCSNTIVLVTSAGLDIEGGSIAAASPLEAALRARDVDDLDVLFTRAAIELLWHDENLQGTKVLFNTETGTSKYTATISAAWTREPGQYTLSVRVANGASDHTGNAGSCEALRRSITVTSDSTQLILALVLVGIVLGVFALGSCLLYKNRESAKKFFLSFLSFEGMLATDIALEAWDFAGTPSPPWQFGPSARWQVEWSADCRRRLLLLRSSETKQQALGREARPGLHDFLRLGLCCLARVHRRQVEAARTQAQVKVLRTPACLQDQGESST